MKARRFNLLSVTCTPQQDCGARVVHVFDTREGQVNVMACPKGGKMNPAAYQLPDNFDPPSEDPKFSEIIEDDELRVICPSCRHTVEPYERKGADENGVYIWLECPDCYEDITDAEEI